MSNELSADEVVAKAIADLPDGAFLTSAVVVLTYVRPGEDDGDERGPFLSWLCDTTSGRWSHLGMVETVAGDMRASLASLALRGDDD